MIKTWRTWQNFLEKWKGKRKNLAADPKHLAAHYDQRNSLGLDLVDDSCGSDPNRSSRSNPACIVAWFNCILLSSSPSVPAFTSTIKGSGWTSSLALFLRVKLTCWSTGRAHGVLGALLISSVDFVMSKERKFSSKACLSFALSLLWIFMWPPNACAFEKPLLQKAQE